MKNQNQKTRSTFLRSGVDKGQVRPLRLPSSGVLSTVFLFAFVVWTVLVKTVGVKAIGPNGSSVGFARLNAVVRDFTGYNHALYVLTDWLGLVPVGVALCFATVGLAQLIKRKSLLKVDPDILLLGAFYVALGVVYVLFEKVKINFRPVLIEGILETSYPSSTTLLVACIMPTAIMQFNARIKNQTARKIACVTATVFTAFMVVGRVVAGVHWITDIIGGVLISMGLVLAYYHFMVKFSK